MGNCAKVLAEKQDEELKNYLIQLFEWLQDMNWLGAEFVYDRLHSMPPAFIYHAYSYCLKVTMQTNDHSWLGCLKTFAEDNELVNLLPEYQRKFLANTVF